MVYRNLFPLPKEAPSHDRKFYAVLIFPFCEQMCPYHDQHEPKSYHVQQGTTFVHLFLASTKYYISIDLVDFRQQCFPEITGHSSDGRVVRGDCHFVK
jgi:hypothetical protein